MPPSRPKARHGLPRYPIPVALIGRLAVHRDIQKQGFGEKLLMDAFQRVVVVSEQAGCAGILVHAKNATAEGFYDRYGVRTLDPKQDYPREMFIRIETVRASIS